MFSLSDNILPFNDDPFTVRYIYETIQHEVKVHTYIVPDECRGNPIIRAITEVIRLQKFRNYTNLTQNVYINIFIKFCEFISGHPAQAKADDVGVITPNFRNYLANHEMEIKYDSIRRAIGFLNNVLIDACDPIYEFESCDWWTEEIRNVKNNTKPLKRIHSNAKPCLKDCFPESKYSDEEIFISLRRVSLWLISEMNSIRRMIKKHSGLCSDLLNTYDGLGYEETSFSNYGVTTSPFIEKYLGGQLIEAIINSGSATAMEIMYYNPKRLFLIAHRDKKLATITDIVDGLNSRLRFANEKRSPKIIRQIVGNKRYMANRYFYDSYGKEIPVNALTAFSPLSIYSNTLAEQLALQWFLASERIQSSGIDRLNLSDVISDTSEFSKARQIQIQFYKGRGDNSYSSSLFKKNTPAFNAIRDYLRNELEMQEKLAPSLARSGKLLQKRYKAMIHYTCQLSESSMLPMKLLGIKGSQMHSKCLSEVDGAEAFLEVLELIGHSNAIRVEQMQSYNKIRVRAKKDKSIVVPSRALIVKEKMLNVSLSSIAQSRALMEDSDDDDSRLTAAFSAHSEETHNTAYVDRHENILKKAESKDARFGASVGDEMAVLAKKVAGFRNQVSVLSEQEVNKKLGLSYSLKSAKNNFPRFDRFLNDAKLKGFEVGILGNVSDDNTTYIIQNSVTCALILAYIDHINKNIDSLSVDSEVRAKLANLHKIYLTGIVSRFPKKIVKEAKSLKCNFPFPDML